MRWPEKFDLKDVYRRLGYPVNATPNAITIKMVDEIAVQMLTAATPRIVKKEFSIMEIKAFLIGEDINRHLTDCPQCLLMAATLGSQIDTLIRKVSVSDMNEAVIMDATASALIEAVMEDFDAQVSDEYLQQSRYITSRFSPGYGDFPITLQNDFINLLDAGRKIGLYATSSHILTPRKSITAVSGISTQPVAGHLAGCDSCKMKHTCQFKKEGKTCETKTL